MSGLLPVSMTYFLVGPLLDLQMDLAPITSRLVAQQFHEP